MFFEMFLIVSAFHGQHRFVIDSPKCHPEVSHLEICDLFWCFFQRFQLVKSLRCHASEVVGIPQVLQGGLVSRGAIAKNNEMLEIFFEQNEIFG